MHYPAAPDVLPQAFRRYFWDVDADDLRWTAARDFIIERLLQSGSWESVQWLRSRLGDAELREWILVRHGAALTCERLRYWQLALDLPAAQVDRWVAAARADVWGGRTAR